jgi:hypothetical protein
VSSSAFHYFENEKYAEQVIVRMLEKSNLKVVIADVPDLKHKEESERIRRDKYPAGEYDEKYKGLSHYYYDKGWFEGIAQKLSLNVSFYDHHADYAVGNPLRFNVVFDK